RRVEQMDLQLLSTHRSDIEASPHFAQLLGTPGPELLSLEPLGEHAISHLVRDMLALDEVPTQLGRFLAERSEGNPYFVTEMLQFAVETEQLKRQPTRGWFFDGLEDGGYDAIGLPPSFDALVRKRVETMQAMSHRVLSAAAVMGYACDEHDLRQVVDIGDSPFLGAIIELEHRRVLEALPNGR